MQAFRVLGIFLFIVSSAGAQSEREDSARPTKTSQVMSEVVVEGRADEDKPPVEPKPDVEEGKIYAGKKTTVTDLSSLPSITTNNYRQALSQTPGLFTSEVSNEGILSLSFRGLGDPHESFNINVLKDGVPIAADPFGYPANYYQPPLESLEKLEFLRGGAGLLYGPQIGGALNYITRDPEPNEPFTLETKQVFGERNLYSTYNQVSGTKDGIGYLGFFHRRQSDGFRQDNSDYSVNNGALKVTFETGNRAEWTMGFDAYDADHGDAGGLAREAGENLISFPADRSQSGVRFDRLRIERYAPTAKLKYDVDAETTFYGNLFAAYYRRFSRRQSAGDAATFGGIYNGTGNNLVLQEFKSVGLDARVSHNWQMGEDKQTLAVGMLLYGVDSPFRQQSGSTPFADSGSNTKLVDRYTLDGAIFAENKFVFGDLSITPGVRIENIYQDIEEDLNTSSSDGVLRQDSEYDFVPLPGLGAAYNLGQKSEIYANISTSFKPKTYTDSIPLNTGDTISEDLDPARGQMYEVGVRGNPKKWLQFDASTFYIQFDDQFGRVETNIQNVGDSETFGFDVGGNIGSLAFLDEALGSGLSESVGELRLYANGSFLDAEFTKGPADGKTPQYAPDYIIRTGVVYDYFNLAKVAMMGTLVDDHFGDDGNSANFAIPSYAIWDLSAEVNIWNNQLSLLAGVNNLFDKEYFSRVRSNGIDPGLPRYGYGGFIFRY